MIKTRILSTAAAFMAAFFMCATAQAAAINTVTVSKENGIYALGAPIYVNVRVLAANTAESFMVPTGPASKRANYVSFSSTCDFYANYTTTAAVAAADVTDGSGSELNPLVRIIDGATTAISVISASTCIITASFYM